MTKAAIIGFNIGFVGSSLDDILGIDVTGLWRVGSWTFSRQDMSFILRKLQDSMKGRKKWRKSLGNWGERKNVIGQVVFSRLLVGTAPAVNSKLSCVHPFSCQLFENISTYNGATRVFEIYYVKSRLFCVANSSLGEGRRPSRPVDPESVSLRAGSRGVEILISPPDITDIRP